MINIPPKAKKFLVEKAAVLANKAVQAYRQGMKITGAGYRATLRNRGRAGKLLVQMTPRPSSAIKNVNSFVGVKKLTQEISKYPGNSEYIEIGKKATQAFANKMVNARGAGIRFIRKGGRIIPIRPK